MIDLTKIDKHILGTDIDIIKCLKMRAIVSDYGNFLKEGVIKNVLRLIKTYAFKQYNYIYNDNNSANILFIYSHIFYREDSIEKFMNVVNVLKYSDVIYPQKNNRLKLRNNKSNPSLIRIFKWYRMLNKVTCSLENRIGFLIQILQIAQFLEDLKTIRVDKYKLLTVYYDASPLENAIVQRFQMKGIKTATLQHGMFVAEREIDDLFYSGVEIRASISDYFLTWNNFTKNELMQSGINHEKIKVLGIPKYINNNLILKNYEKKKCDVFGVVLDVPQYNELNAELVKFANFFAEKYNLKYKIKYHPNANQCEMEGYIDNEYCIGKFNKLANFKDYIDNVDFSIMISSSIFMEFSIHQHPTFRYICSDVRDRYNGILENSFRNIDELYILYENPISVKNNVDLLYNLFHVEESRLKYIEFFDEFSIG